MKPKQFSSENGQVLVILVMVMVGLLAFTALAIDGGLIWADRRGSQNAGDAAVLAGGFRIANTLEDYQKGYNINYLNWDCAAIAPVMEIGELEAAQQAAANGYPITTTAKLVTTIYTNCENGEDFGLYVDKYVDTTAEFTSQVDTSFLHFAYGGVVKNTIQAISRVRPRMPLAFGFAIYAFGDGCGTGANPGGIFFNGGGGGGSVYVDGNGVLSNTCLQGNGSVDIIVCEDPIDPDNPVCNNYADIGYGSSYGCSGAGCSISPWPPTEQPEPLPSWALLFSEPKCDDAFPGTSYVSGPTNGGTIYPGKYSGITVNGNDALVMMPGLYCFNGSFNATGGSITADGVTIYMEDGNISIGGNVDPAVFSAPTYVVDPEDGVKGMLIYMAESNDGSISLAGNSNSTYTGVIFAANPDSTVDISGTADAVFNTQLIAGAVTVGGNAHITVNFNEGLVYHLPARLTLEK